MLFSNDEGTKDPGLHRRDILKIGLAGLLSATIPLFAAGTASAAPFYGSWRIALRHTHTGESFSGVYRIGDKYLPDTFERLNLFLRDFRTKQVFPMDPRVVDIISAIQTKTGARHMEVLSGYRSPKTNSMLRHETSGVAKNSFHMYGQAIDFRVPGYNTGRLRKVAMGMKAGGVGYYPKSDFVHVDTGKVRSW
ncbi:MAG: DUF882 domain-containing protein [Alphaproteobacteria bacterium]|nr:DUF882 domain-containing protein [Alphaproteobacteria bacterium]